MLHFLHFQLKFSLLSIFAMLNLFMTYSTMLNRNAVFTTKRHFLPKPFDNFEVLRNPALVMPPCDLSTSLQQWRYIGNKNGYANFFTLDDVLVFPGSYDAKLKWQMSFSYFVKRESGSSAHLTLVVSRDQGQTWTPWLDIQPSKPYLQTTDVEFDDAENQGQLFFGLKGSDKHVADLEIEDLDIAPAPSMHSEEHTQMTEGEEVLLTEQEDKLALADLKNATEYYQELLAAYREYEKGIKLTATLPTELAGEESLHEITLDYDAVQSLSWDYHANQLANYELFLCIDKAGFVVNADSLSCKSLSSKFLVYSKALVLRATETQHIANHTYYLAYEKRKYKRNEPTLVEALKGLKKSYPEVISSCEFTPGDLIDVPFLGEPQNICVAAAVHYDLLLLQSESKEDALLGAENEVFYASALLPGGKVSQISNFINENCLSKSNQDNTIEIYDILVFKNNLESYEYFSSEENKFIKKNLQKGNISKFEKTSVPCSQALARIEAQSRHWHSMVSAIDTSNALASDKSFLGKDIYKIYTYKFKSGNDIKEYKTFDTILRMASLILSTNGYLNQNIKNYEGQCIDNADASSFYKLLEKDKFDYVLNLRTTQLENLHSSMNSIVAKEFNNFAAPELSETKRD